jgi:SAM-dependent methyltransferase
MRRNKKLNVQSNSRREYSGKQELVDAEAGLESYNLDIVSQFYRNLNLDSKDQKLKLMDFGAGTGALAEIWQREYGINPICLEIDNDLCKILNDKGFATFQNLDLVSNDFTAVYTSNVLEHIEDDRKSLRDIRAIMQVGGKLAIYVPALPFLFSDMDAQVGHYRRYKRKELIEKVQESGFTVEKCYWNDCIGVAAWFSLKILGYKGKVGIGSKRSLVIYDKFVYPISKILDKLFFKKIIGKNLFLFAKAK